MHIVLVYLEWFWRNGPFLGYFMATIYSRSLGGDTGLGHSTAPLVAVTIGTLRLSSTLKLG